MAGRRVNPIVSAARAVAIVVTSALLGGCGADTTSSSRRQVTVAVVNRVILFHSDDCPECIEVKSELLEVLRNEHANLELVDSDTPEGLICLTQCEEAAQRGADVAAPVLFVEGHLYVGAAEIRAAYR